MHKLVSSFVRSWSPRTRDATTRELLSCIDCIQHLGHLGHSPLRVRHTSLKACEAIQRCCCGRLPSISIYAARRDTSETSLAN